MYKLSQFVFHTESANGDLLLYNTLIGRASLLNRTTKSFERFCAAERIRKCFRKGFGTCL